MAGDNRFVDVLRHADRNPSFYAGLHCMEDQRRNNAVNLARDHRSVVVDFAPTKQFRTIKPLMTFEIFSRKAIPTAWSES